MIGEHPASEKDTVIVRGRVQGGLQPTRAFGDAVYKWTRDQATR
jgi:pyruvate dehydrogenase phosphatase